MLLFTKVGCKKCDYLKTKCDLSALGIQVEELGPGNAEALANLAWYELVSVAEKHLPILVLDDASYIADVIPILRYIKGAGRPAEELRLGA